MTIKARREYLAAIRLGYKSSTKGQRSKILDEFCAVCHYNRKHTIRILGKDQEEFFHTSELRHDSNIFKDP